MQFRFLALLIACWVSNATLADGVCRDTYYPLGAYHQYPVHNGAATRVDPNEALEAARASLLSEAFGDPILFSKDPAPCTNVQAPNGEVRCYDRGIKLFTVEEATRTRSLRDATFAQVNARVGRMRICTPIY